MPRYRLSLEAQADLTGIRDFIARDSPASALALLEQFTSCFELLGHQPFLGRSRNELRDGLRSYVHKNYVVFYRPARHGVDIVRVLHGRRDLNVLF